MKWSLLKLMDFQQFSTSKLVTKRYTETLTHINAHAHIYIFEHNVVFFQAITYTGRRDLEAFSRFLDNGGVLPKEESEEVDDEDDQEGDPAAEDEDKTDEQSKVCFSS